VIGFSYQAGRYKILAQQQAVNVTCKHTDRQADFKLTSFEQTDLTKQQRWKLKQIIK